MARVLKYAFPSEQAAVQKWLETRRTPHDAHADSNMIDGNIFNLRVNQFHFLQEDVRAVPEDTVWGLICIRLREEVEKRIRKVQGRSNIYPFRVRFLVRVKGIGYDLAYEPNEPVTSPAVFERVLINATEKIRKALANVDPKFNSETVYDLHLRMQTIESLFESAHVLHL